MMKPSILLVNPPIHDFSAYDFWLRPYGLLSVAGFIRHNARITLFDYLDRRYPATGADVLPESDAWGRGRFPCRRIDRPACLSAIPRHFRRFGRPRETFQRFIADEGPFDFALVQTSMTYWYPAVAEVIDDIRRFSPGTRIILGGNYATLCTRHAAALGADLVVAGTNLDPLWEYANIRPDLTQPAYWQAYPDLDVGVLKLADGCPFTCTYCSVPRVYGRFRPRPIERSLAEIELLCRLGARNIAFYDDALLFHPDLVLKPFLNEVIRRRLNVNFHSPNALNARFLSKEIAELMVRAGFKTFYLGFENASLQWQQRTGSKVFSGELAQAVDRLVSAGAQSPNITAYQILGHPHTQPDQLENSMRFVNSLGVRGMLADFSPIPGTPDGEYCRRYVDLDEPLMHNKTAFPIILLGFDESNRLKELQRRLNRNLRN